MILRYRKVHLFDIDLEDKVNSVSESRHTLPGDSLEIAPLGPFQSATLICYDLRFPEIWSAARRKGTDLFILPANFTQKTGEAHWHTLIQARAIETQSYVLASAQIGIHPKQNFPTYGHAMIADPWGRILAETDASPDTNGDSYAVADLDLNIVKDVRRKMPILNHRRPELYT